MNRDISGAGRQSTLSPQGLAGDETLSPAVISQTEAPKQLAQSSLRHEDSNRLNEMKVVETTPISNVRQDTPIIESLESEYKGRCDRLAELKGRQEIALRLEEIRHYIQNFRDFDTSCGFELKYVSKSGKIETFLPPIGMSESRQQELRWSNTISATRAYARVFSFAFKRLNNDPLWLFYDQSLLMFEVTVGI